MKMRYLLIVLSLLTFLLILNIGNAVVKIEPDSEGVALVNRFAKALSIKNSKERLKAVLPCLHSTLKDNSGKALNRNVRDFSYKKACNHIRFYQLPVKIYQVHKGRLSTIGYGERAERGRTDKYFISKKPEVKGMAAPIKVFWPAKGGKPSIVYMGSL